MVRALRRARLLVAGGERVRDGRGEYFISLSGNLTRGRVLAFETLTQSYGYAI
jgi:hypothetical protein